MTSTSRITCTSATGLTAAHRQCKAPAQVARVAHPPARQWRGRMVRVHAGFLASWAAQGIRDGVLALVKDVLAAGQQDIQIIACGHSLGAQPACELPATAAIAARHAIYQHLMWHTSRAAIRDTCTTAGSVCLDQAGTRPHMVLDQGMSALCDAGGAIASLAAHDIVTRCHARPHSVSVYTFGCPRVCHPLFFFCFAGCLSVHM